MIDDRTRSLLMAAVDDELSPEERRDLDALVARSADVRRELERMTRVKDVTISMTWKEPAVETWDRYWNNVYNRTERKIAWLLVLAGALVLSGWALWEAVPHLFSAIWNNATMPMPVRVAAVALILGLLLLVVSVIREQLTVRRNDPYKGVSR
jgi:hypothetical protein